MSSTFSKRETGAYRVVSALIQRPVPHHVHNRSMTLEPGAIKVAPVSHTDQVKYLNRIKRTRTMTGERKSDRPTFGQAGRWPEAASSLAIPLNSLGP